MISLEKNHKNTLQINSFVPIVGCPEGWVAGTSSCYQLSKGFVTNRDFAVKRCALRGGHLVAIESEAENQFLSHTFASGLNGIIPFYLNCTCFLLIQLIEAKQSHQNLQARKNPFYAVGMRLKCTNKWGFYPF